MAKQPKRIRDRAKDKMKEASTWNGLSVIGAIGTLGMALKVNELAVLSDPVVAGAVATIAAAVVGIWRSEKK